MSSYPDPESLRPGGLPADDLYEPPFDAAKQDEALRGWAWDDRSKRGRDEDGDPRVASLGKDGIIWAGAGALTKTVPCRCGHHPLGTIMGSRAAAECAARVTSPPETVTAAAACGNCGQPMPDATPNAKYCSPACRVAAHRARKRLEHGGQPR
jgi:hypothetical protein